VGDLRTQVGNLVRHHRERAGLTQAQLAERIDKSVQLIGGIERGASAPSFDTLEAMASTFELQVRDFFGVADYAAGAGQDDPLTRLVQQVSALDTDDLEWVIQLIDLALSRKPPRRLSQPAGA
jgi:transcriptional regulator with XRE-family HTH domain